MKRCSRCKKEKSLEYFHKCSSGTQGVQGYCKDCQRESGRTYDSKRYTKEKGQREWQKRKNDPKYHARRKEWLELNQEDQSKKARERYLSNRDRYTAYRANDSASKKNVEGRIDPKEWLFIIGLINGKCLACGEPPEDLITLDHVIPMAKGGLNKIENVQPLCLRCNLKKGTRSVDFRNKEFIESVKKISCQ